jgi:ornithine decarboxylase
MVTSDGDDGASGSSDSHGSSSNSGGPSSFMYYVNDGIYGSFNCIMFDHYTVVPSLLQVRYSPQIITNLG